MIKKHWWKALAVLIVLYSIIAGMLIPLKPGILQVHPYNLEAGTSPTLIVNTYNTKFEQGDNIRAWISIDSNYAIPARETRMLNNRQLSIDFDLPTFLPFVEKSKSLALVLDEKEHGAFVRPRAINITQNTIDTTRAQSVWTYPPIKDIHRYDKMSFPMRGIIYETIKNTFYHVPLWFGMVLILLGAMIYSIKYLQKADPFADLRVLSYTRIGVLFGILGCVTGSIWAKNTWGTWWTFEEIKLNVSAIALLIYLAYFVLRSSFEDEEKRARISAVYSIFAFVAMVPLLFVIPRMTEASLHPGNGGNPGFGGDDLDNSMRMVFYPAIIGWTLLGVWMANLVYRADVLSYKMMEKELS